MEKKEDLEDKEEQEDKDTDEAHVFSISSATIFF